MIGNTAKNQVDRRPYSFGKLLFEFSYRWPIALDKFTRFGLKHCKRRSERSSLRVQTIFNGKFIRGRMDK